MNVDTMRFIDRYVGTPLCFIGTAIHKLFFKKGKIRPKNILFVELSEMGSAIIVDPAMRKAKAVHNAELFFLIFKKNKPSLELLQTIDDENIFVIDADGMVGIVRDTFRFLMWARKRKIDTVIDLELFSRYTALLSGFAGANNVVGFHRFHSEGLYRGNMMTHKMQYNPQQHIGKNFIAMVNALSENSDGTPYSKTFVHDSELELAKANILPEKKESVINVLKKLTPEYSEGKGIILINPNASELLPQRRWQKDKYAEVISMLSEKYPEKLIMITGAKGEMAEAQKLVKMSGAGNCYSTAGLFHLSELTALYTLSEIMVTNDSGPAHFASVTNMPTVVIFGPETPALYRSLGDTTPIFAGLSCSPCVSAANHRKTPCHDNVCLQVITAEQVFNTVVERLG